MEIKQYVYPAYRYNDDPISGIVHYPVNHRRGEVMDKQKALMVYMLREDKGMNFVDIARTLGGISGQEAAKAWLMVKDAREAHANREKVVYRKRHINKNRKKVKPATIKRVDTLKNTVIMDAFNKAMS